jgi:hypothetical protein
MLIPKLHRNKIDVSCSSPLKQRPVHCLQDRIHPCCRTGSSVSSRVVPVESAAEHYFRLRDACGRCGFHADQHMHMHMHMHRNICLLPHTCTHNEMPVSRSPWLRSTEAASPSTSRAILTLHSHSPMTLYSKPSSAATQSQMVRIACRIGEWGQRSTDVGYTGMCFTKAVAVGFSMLTLHSLTPCSVPRVSPMQSKCTRL